MAYHKHDSTESAGYDSNSSEMHVFFEEDKQKYSSGNYDSNNDPFSGGYKAKEEEDEKRKEELSEFEKQLEGEQEKKEEHKEADEEFIKRKAADEIKVEMDQFDGQKIEEKKKNKGNIDEAIEKAIKEEKEVIHLDY